MRYIPILLLLSLTLVGCGIRATKGQTVAELEQANPAYHYVPPSSVTGSVEIRNYRNYNPYSLWSYFKPWRSYHIVFDSGVVSDVISGHMHESAELVKP